MVTSTELKDLTRLITSRCVKNQKLQDMVYDHVETLIGNNIKLETVAVSMLDALRFTIKLESANESHESNST